MEEITDISYNEKDDESTRQEKNRILVDREILVCFSYGFAELQEKELIDYDDMENSTETIDGEEDVPKEIYEYWIVTDWLYEKLKSLDEPVCEWADLKIWGRTCTGQSIALDYTMDEVRKTLN